MGARGITCTFTGQTLIDESVQPSNEEKYNELKDWVNKSTVRFTNIEGAIVDSRPGWPMKTDYLHIVNDDILDLLQEYGFNLFSLSNNHSWDAGINGILDTLELMEERSLAHAGTGRNLEAAREPAYLETPGGTVALVAMAGGNLPRAVCQYPQQYPAYATSRQRTNRPGVNPLRIEDYYQLPEKAFKRIKKTAEELRDHGFPPRFYAEIEADNNSVELLGTVYVPGDGYDLVRRVDDSHRDCNLDTIREANDKADLVLAYLHEHHWENDMMEVGDWHREFAKDCIDAGAHCFITHGVPKLLPMEIYNGCPIFYSLGNFIYHSTGSPDRWTLQSVAIRGNFEDGCWKEIKAKPLTLIEPRDLHSDNYSGPHRNMPMSTSVQHGHAILERFQRISEPFGAEITIEEGNAVLLD